MDDVDIFISYAHQDKALVKTLEQHLLFLKRQGLITTFYDSEISKGGEWKTEIQRALDSAKIILLMVSPDFIISAFAYDTEMEHALERHQRGEARVIPIILRPAMWRGEPFGVLRSLPRGGKAITNWADRDAAFFDVAQGIQKVVEQMQTTSSPSSPYSISTQDMHLPPSNSPSSVSEPDSSQSLASKKRLADLEKIIRTAYSSVQGNEQLIRVSDAPEEKQQAQKSINEQLSITKDYYDEYKELARQLNVSVPIDIIEIATHLSERGSAKDRVDTRALREALSKEFSLEELRLLSLDLGVEFEDLPSQNTELKIFHLIDYMKRRSRLEDLVVSIRRRRPFLQL